MRRPNKRTAHLYHSLMLKENLMSRLSKNGSELMAPTSATDNHEAIMTPPSPVLKHVKIQLITAQRLLRRGLKKRHIHESRTVSVPALGREHMLRRLISLFLVRSRGLNYSSICLIFKKVILIKHELFQSYSVTPLHVGFFALGLQKNKSICVKKNDMNFAN